MTPEPLDRVLLDRISASLRSDLRPVRPLPSTGVLVVALLAIFAAVALAGASVFGFYGWHRLSPAAAAAIFAPLAALATLMAVSAVSRMIPGARRAGRPAFQTAMVCTIMVGIFDLLFQDHRTDGFVPQGIACLKTGLLWAMPAALGTWLVLRRGFAVDARAAGLAIGALAGLAGLAMLELHCPNFRLPHVAVWHTAVVPVAALAGYFLGSKRKAAELMQ